MNIATRLASLAALLVTSTVPAAAVEILDYAQRDGHTYYLLSASDWTEADAAATRLGGGLATIDSVEENDFLQTRFAQVASAYAPANMERSFWIGFQDLTTEGTFIWISGAGPGYTKWAPGYPAAADPSHDFASVDASGPQAGFWKDTASQGEAGRSYYGIVEVPVLENLTINPPADLISWWPGENTAWDVAGEGGGSMKNASLGGQGAYAPGKVGRAFSFDGTNDHIQALDAPGIDLTGNFTIEAWIRDSGATGERCIISKRNPDNLDVSYSLFLRDGMLRFASRTGGAAFSDSAGPAIPANQWVHVAVTANGTSLRFYKDGILTTHTTHPTNRPDTSGAVTIGGTVTVANPTATPDAPFAGEIDELSLYSRALSAAEIDAIYWVGSGGKDRHDPARDFSETSNPNAPWSFDYFPSSDPSFSGTFPAPAVEAESARILRYAAFGLQVSLVRSFTDRYVTTGGGGTEISCSPRQFHLHPGISGMGTAIRWTAPESGRFAISGTFTGADARPTSTRAYLFQGNTQNFPQVGESNSISSYLGDGVSFTRILDLEQGDQISWLVDPNGSNSFDNTGLVASAVLLEEVPSGGLDSPTFVDPIETNLPHMTGRNWRFHAENNSRPDHPTMTAKIQYSATPNDPDSWVDLGDMRTSGSMRFILDTSNVPVGSYAFRIVTTVAGVGTTYSEASPVYDIVDAAPYLETEVDVSSASNPDGTSAHRGDLLTYTIRFKNSGAAFYQSLKARIEFPFYHPAGTVPAQVTAEVTTPGGQKTVLSGRNYWEWPISAIRPVGEIPYGEAKTASRVVKQGNKKVRIYDGTFFSMPNEPLHGYENGDVLRLHQYFTTALPTGLQTGRDYYVVNATAGKFQISTTPGGAPYLLKVSPTTVISLHFERTNEWQTRKISFRLANPTDAQETAQANAGLPPILPDGSMISSNCGIVGAATGNVIGYAYPLVTTLKNPLRLTVTRSVTSGPVAQGGLVYFDLTATNESTVGLARAAVFVAAPRGLAIQTAGDHPVFLDDNGMATGIPIDAATRAAVVRPASWKTNPEVLEEEILGPDVDSVPSFEQNARFYFGTIAPLTTKKMRVTCRVQYDWDTDSDPVLTFEDFNAVFAGSISGITRHCLNEEDVNFDIMAIPDSGKPKISVWVTQAAMGALSEDSSVATVASVQGLTRIPQVPGSEPSRGINEIAYEATYANFGGASANYVRLWMPIPENTEVVRANLVRTVTKFRIIKKDGKKKRVPYTVRIPYTVGSEQVTQAEDDPGEILNPQVVGGGTWFTCLVPSLSAYPNPGWAKTVEVRVKLKPNVAVGTRIEQLSAFATSRELFFVQAPVFANDEFRALVAEVRAPADLQLFPDQTSTISTDANGNPDGYESLVDRAILVNRGGVSATGVGLKYVIPYGFKFRDARYIGGNVASTITKPTVGSGGGSEVVFNIGSVPATQGKAAEVILDYDRDTFPDEDTDPTGSSRGGLASSRFILYDDANPLPAEPEGYSLQSVGEPLAAAPYPLAGQLNTRAIFADQARPFIGVVGPSTVHPGQDVTYRIIVGNHSNSGNGGGGFVHIPIPVGATYVGSSDAMEYNGAQIHLLGTFTPANSGTADQLGLHYPNGSISHAIALTANSCVVIDFTVRVDANATGSLIFLGPGFGGEFSNGRVTKSPISCAEIVSVVSPAGTLNRQAVFESQIGSGAAAALGSADQPVSEFAETRGQITGNSVSACFGGADLVTVAGNNIALIPLGDGHLVAAGGGNLVGGNGAIIQASGSALVAAGGGNLVAAGAGNLISIDVPTKGRLYTAAEFFADLPRLQAPGGSANLVNAGGLNLVRRLVGNDGASLVGQDGGTLIGLNGEKLADTEVENGAMSLVRPDGARFALGGSGKLVAAGAGNLVAAGGGNVVPTNAGNLVAAGAGNLVAAGAGNFVNVVGINLIPANQLVAAGGGNVVPTNAGGNLVGQDGGTFGNLVAAGGGNLVAAGGGNLVAAGGGNVVNVSAGLVAAGGGN